MPTGVPTDPEVVNDATLALSDPMMESIRQVALEAGLGYTTAKDLAQKLQRKNLVLSRAIGQVKKGELKDLFAFQAHRILAAITDEDIAEAKLRDKMLAAAIATDKHLLLDGQPTEILSVKELGALNDVCEMLAVEMRRRGLEAMTNDGTQQVSVIPTSLGTRRDFVDVPVAPTDEPKR